MNVVREMAIAANIPMPRSTSSTTRRPTPSPPAAIPSTRRSRSRPACSRSSTARSCRASSATSCRTSATSTSGSRCRRGHGRRDRDPGRLLPALHVLGRRPVARPRQRRWRRRSQAIIMLVAIVAGDPRADHQPVHPARRQPPARVPGRRLVGRADPQPVRPGAGAGQDLAATRRSSRSPTAGPSTCTSPTRSRSSRSARRA